jgi:accessory gene regulator protein AgrB
MQIQMVGIHLFMRIDRQTDVMKLMVTFHDYFVYSPKNGAHGKHGDTCTILFVLFLVTLWINMNVFLIFWFQVVIFELFTAGTQIVFADQPILGPVAE